MRDLIYTLPGLWLSRTMIGAARFASPHLDKPGAVAIVEAGGRRYAVRRMGSERAKRTGHKIKILKVCLESDLPNFDEDDF